MKATVVGLVTPHLLTIIDLAKLAETGANVDWHLKDAIAKTVADLGHLYNARDLLSAYVQGLETAMQEARPGRTAYVGALRVAIEAARRNVPPA